MIIQKESGRKNAIFFGDSISYGELVSPHKTWVTRVSQDIETHFADEFLAINTSVNGNTTRIALERMPFDVQRYGVEFLAVQFGMNDCNYWKTDQGVPRTDAQAFRSNLREIIRRGKHFGAKRVLLPTSHPTPLVDRWDYADCSYEESRSAYAQITREVADTVDDVRLVDIEVSFNEALEQGKVLERLLMPDGIHLSDEGHDLYYRTFSPIVIEELRDLSETH